MKMTIELHEREFDAKFLRSIKALFQNQQLRVTIKPEDEDGLTPAMKEKLHKSLEEVGKTVSGDKK